MAAWPAISVFDEQPAVTGPDGDALTDELTIYQVGGSVRDQLLGQPSADRDFVVVGSSPDAMLARGFKPVGRDFPVFLRILGRTRNTRLPGPNASQGMVIAALSSMPVPRSRLKTISFGAI